ncbi:uncharacterized protein ACBT57_017312 [Dama dama]
MNLQATVLPALLGTQIGRCSFPWGGQSLHPAWAACTLPCPVRSPQGWMQGSVIRSPGWGCPRSACARPALLFLVLWVRWPGRTVYLLSPAGEAGRRVVTVLLALVTQAWLSCSHPNQLYTQVSAWLKPPVSPPCWALAHSVRPTPPPGSPRAEQFRFFSCKDLRPTPALISHRGVYWETLGELPELKKQLDTQAFGGSCPELTAASQLAAVYPGQSLRRPVTWPPVPVSFPSERSWHLGLGQVHSCRWASPGLGGRELLGQQCHPRPLPAWCPDPCHPQCSPGPAVPPPGGSAPCSALLLLHPQRNACLCGGGEGP